MRDQLEASGPGNDHGGGTASATFRNLRRLTSDLSSVGSGSMAAASHVVMLGMVSNAPGRVVHGVQLPSWAGQPIRLPQSDCMGP